GAFRSAVEMARDDQALDLAGALADLAQLRVSEDALGGAVPRVADPAEDLNGAVRRAHGDLGGEELRERALHGEGEPAVLAPRGLVHEVAGRGDLHRPVGEAVAHGLVVDEARVELP